jgi:hypothetical protein
MGWLRPTTRPRRYERHTSTAGLEQEEPLRVGHIAPDLHPTAHCPRCWSDRVSGAGGACRRDRSVPLPAFHTLAPALIDAAANSPSRINLVLSRFLSERNCTGSCSRSISAAAVNWTVSEPKARTIRIAGIMALFHQLPRVRSVLERFPTVSVALDHLAVPRLSSGPPYDGAQTLSTWSGSRTST